MLLAALRRRDTPAADLARVLACWLAVILLAQGLAALQTLVRGPAHRHLAPAGARDDGQALPSTVAPAAAGTISAAASHALSHALGLAHYHAADEVAVPAGAEAALDAAACVLLAALAALAVSYGWAVRAAGSRPVASATWVPAENHPPPPRRPPRA